MHFYGSESAEGGVISTTALWVVISLTSGSFFVFFVFFLSIINPKYHRTFFSLMTAKEAERNMFMAAEEPEAKLWVFVDPPFMWEDFREELKEYVLDNFEEWETGKPRWWTETLKSRIPEDMIPETARKRELKKRQALEIKKKFERSSGVIASIVELVADEDDSS